MGREKKGALRIREWDCGSGSISKEKGFSPSFSRFTATSRETSLYGRTQKNREEESSEGDSNFSPSLAPPGQAMVIVS